VGKAFGWSGLRTEAAAVAGTVVAVAGIGAFTVAAVATVAGTVVAVVVAGIGAFTIATVVDFRIHPALCGFGSAIGWAQRSCSLNSAPAHCKSPLSSPDS
jgi:predicted membrane GTPase involved in stress response